MSKVRNFVFDTFMRLTSKTVPYGYEDKFVDDVLSFMFPQDIQKDINGNYFYEIGDSRTIFASHIDTVSKDYVDVEKVVDGKFIKTKGKTTLGADDKAGMTVMLWMIEKGVPGLYYFFIGEEVGCIGSGLAAKSEAIEGNYDRVISFDRRGTDSIITFQSAGRCCSDAFADALAAELNKSNMNYKKDTGGVYTDSAEFMELAPECTNISVGYYKEHTVNESQDIEHLEKLAIACVNVDWENLPVERDPSVVEYSYYGNGYNYHGWDHDSWDHDWNNNSYGNSYRRKKTRRSKKRKSSKVYLDKGGSLYDITNSINKNEDKYTWILNKYCNGEFTYKELETIKECYLDINSEYDKWFFEYLKEQAIDY